MHVVRIDGEEDGEGGPKESKDHSLKIAETNRLFGRVVRTKPFLITGKNPNVWSLSTSLEL